MWAVLFLPVVLQQKEQQRRSYITISMIHTTSIRLVIAGTVQSKHTAKHYYILATNHRILHTSQMTATHKAKQALRKQIRTSISSLSPQEISQQSTQVWERVFQLPEYQSSQSVGIFLSMPKGEIQTDEACSRVLADGKTLYVPRVGLDFEQCDMDLIRVPFDDYQFAKKNNVSFYNDWPRNKWGIPEAPADDVKYQIAHSGDIDLLIVPGLGFDENGGRLGQGKGYYDRFIHSMREGQTQQDDGASLKPILLAVGLTPSFVQEGIPMMKHDFQMDMLVLPDAMFTMEKN
jgi:5-formyltetrahydrofolate cyclo-ligase